jgi:two-component system LytT family response regulator
MSNNPIIDVLIVDDEAASRGVLHKLLSDIHTFRFNIHEAGSVEAALEIASTKKIDLLFLDVQMPEQNGFDLLSQIKDIDFEIIFVTGYDKYAVHAFRFNALDYLLKPVEISELKQAVDKATLRISQKQSLSKNVSELLHGLPGDGSQKKVAVHVNDKVVFLEATNISHITASDNYSEIVTCEKQKFITPRVLKEFEFYFEQLGTFVRINRSVLINVGCIKSYSKDFPCIVEMKTGFQFEISRRKKAEVLKQLELL